MLISKSEYQITGTDLSSYEAEHHFTFPEEYRSFLIKYNGGETPETNFKAAGVSSDLRSLYGFINTESGLELRPDVFWLDEYLKDGMFPIGENCFGDNFFVCVQGQGAGAIFFRYHDRPKRYIKVADTFKEFVQKCKSKKLGHCCTIKERIIMRLKAKNFAPPSKITLAGWQKEIDHYQRIHQEELVV